MILEDLDRYADFLVGLERTGAAPSA